MALYVINVKADFTLGAKEDAECVCVCLYQWLCVWECELYVYECAICECISVCWCDVSMWVCVIECMYECATVCMMLWYGSIQVCVHTCGSVICCRTGLGEHWGLLQKVEVPWEGMVSACAEHTGDDQYTFTDWRAVFPGGQEIELGRLASAVALVSFQEVLSS